MIIVIWLHQYGTPEDIKDIKQNKSKRIKEAVRWEDKAGHQSCVTGQQISLLLVALFACCFHMWILICFLIKRQSLVLNYSCGLLRRADNNNSEYNSDQKNTKWGPENSIIDCTLLTQSQKKERTFYSIIYYIWAFGWTAYFIDLFCFVGKMVKCN